MWLSHLALFPGHHVFQFTHLAAGVSASDASFMWHLLLYNTLLWDWSVLSLSVSLEMNALPRVTRAEPSVTVSMIYSV